MTDSPNYCQHPECHNSRFLYYGEQYGTGTWTHPPRVEGINIRDTPAPGYRRWCWSHAWINEGVAFG